MRFYDVLQMDPMVLVPMAAKAETRRERYRLLFGMVLRSFLIVAVAIAFIGACTAAFGAANTPMAVVIFCLLLCTRFVGFGYRIADTLAVLAALFALLTLAPAGAALLPAAALLPYHLAIYLFIVLAVGRRPEFGNVGLLNFSYIYLNGNPVLGQELAARGWLALLGFVLIGAIMFAKHRTADAEVGMVDVVREFDARGALGSWQLRMALGMAVVLTAGRLFQVERAMWMAFACAAMLSTYPYSHVERVKSLDRLVGAVGGCVAYAVLAWLVPDSMVMMLAPLGGFVMGLCVSYRMKTACNCFGALTLAQQIYGVPAAALLRVWDTLLGVVLAAVFMAIYHAFWGRRRLSSARA